MSIKQNAVIKECTWSRRDYVHAVDVRARARGLRRFSSAGRRDGRPVGRHDGHRDGHRVGHFLDATAVVVVTATETAAVGTLATRAAATGRRDPPPVSATVTEIATASDAVLATTRPLSTTAHRVKETATCAAAIRPRLRLPSPPPLSPSSVRPHEGETKPTNAGHRTVRLRSDFQTFAFVSHTERRSFAQRTDTAKGGWTSRRRLRS